MDITQTRQIEQDVLPFVDAVQWDEATPIQLLGTGSQQAQKYPSDIDLFSAIKRTRVDDLAGIYNHMDTIFENCDALGDMYFIEFKLQNVDGSKQKWFQTSALSQQDLEKAVPAGGQIDFVKVDYVIFIRDRNLFTELSSIYSFSPLPPIRELIEKIRGDFTMYYNEGNYYKSLKRMYSIYRLQDKKEKLVELSTLFNSETGYKYSISSNLKAIKLLLEHYSDDPSIINALRANLSDIGKKVGEKIDTEAKIDAIIDHLDKQIKQETIVWLNRHKSILPPDVRFSGGIRSPFPRMGGKSKLAERLIKMFPKDYKVFVEPFVGGGNVFFRLPEREGVKYYINDKDPMVYKIMKALRDNPKFNDTIDRRALTREQFYKLKEKGKKRTAQEDISFIKNSFFGQAKSYQNPSAGVDRQMAIKTDYSKHHEKLKGVTITNEDFAKVINRHKNNPDAFFYLDPPYFGAEMEKYYPDYVKPDQIANALKGVKGKWMVSYNNVPAVRKAFKGYKIRTIKTMYSDPIKGGVSIPKVEIYITNY
jgi:DNA adenine methylase